MMEIYPHLAYIVVQRPARGGQKLSKAAGFGLGAGGDIDVAVFLDREGAETFQARNPTRAEYHGVVEVVVTDSDTHYAMVERLGTAEARVESLTTELWLAKNPAWMPANLPPGALPDNHGASRSVLAVTDAGRPFVAHVFWTNGPGPDENARNPKWYDDNLNPIDDVARWTSLPRVPGQNGA